MLKGKLYRKIMGLPEPEEVENIIIHNEVMSQMEELKRIITGKESAKGVLNYIDLNSKTEAKNEKDNSYACE